VSINAHISFKLIALKNFIHAILKINDIYIY